MSENLDEKDIFEIEEYLFQQEGERRRQEHTSSHRGGNLPILEHMLVT